MKELTVFEMEEISGGYSWDFSSLSSSLTSLVSNGVEAVGAAILGGTIAAVAGTLIGGTQSGANGGLLGFGLLGNLVGMFWGLAMGAIGGAIGGAAIGWDGTLGYVKETVEGILNCTFVPWSH